MKLRPFFRKLGTSVTAIWRCRLSAALVATAVATVCAVYVYVFPFVLEHSYFRLRTIKVACDTRAVSPQTLAFRAGLHDRMTLWDVETEQAEAALEEAAWVREARVRRRFPAHVSVWVSGRVPVAATITEEGPFLVDAEGVVFREEDGRGFPDLPYLTGWLEARSRGERIARLRRMMALLEAAQDRGYAVSQIDVDAAGAYRLFPETPRVSVELGVDPEPEVALGRLDTVLAQLVGATDAVGGIDLAFNDRVVVTAAEGGLPTLLTAQIGGRDLEEVAEATVDGGPDRG